MRKRLTHWAHATSELAPLLPSQLMFSKIVAKKAYLLKAAETPLFDAPLLMHAERLFSLLAIYLPRFFVLKVVCFNPKEIWGKKRAWRFVSLYWLLLAEKALKKHTAQPESDALYVFLSTQATLIPIWIG